MSFQQTLQTIMDGCGGGFGAALMGLDGIAIEQVGPSEGPHADDPLEGDVTNA